MIDAGAHLDRFVCLETLGRVPPPGQKPRTQLAVDRETGEPVVLLSAPEEAEARGTFQASFRAARQTGNANMPPLLAQGQDDGRAFVAAAWISGPSLSDLLEQASLNESLALSVLWVLVRSLSHLHGQRQFHGDVHPGNIRLDAQGKLQLVGYFPMPYGKPESLLSSRAVTVRYSPPEVADGGPASCEGDVFAVGLVAYELFTGEPLLPARSPTDLRAQVGDLGEEIQTRLESTEGIPEDLLPILSSMLTVDPEKRPRSCSEVMGMLASLPRIDEDAEVERRLKLLSARTTGRVARDLYRSAERTLEKGRLLPSLGELWRSAAAMKPGNRAMVRQGYLLAIRWMWAAKACVDAGEAPPAEAFYLLHRLAARWGSDTLVRLAAEFCHQLVEPDAPLRGRLDRSPLRPQERAQEIQVNRRILLSRPSTEKSILALAVLTDGFQVRPGETIPRATARLLAQHELFKEAIYYRVQELMDSKTPLPILDDISRLAGQAREAAMKQGPSMPLLTAARGDLSPRDEERLDAAAEASIRLESRAPRRPDSFAGSDAQPVPPPPVPPPPSEPPPPPASIPPRPPEEGGEEPGARRPSVDPLLAVLQQAFEEEKAASMPPKRPDSEPSAPKVDLSPEELATVDELHALLDEGGDGLAGDDPSGVSSGDSSGVSGVSVPPADSQVSLPPEDGEGHYLPDFGAGDDDVPLSVPPAPAWSDGAEEPQESLTLEDATVLFTRAQTHLLDEELDEAAKVLDQLMAAGVLERQHFYSSVCAELRNLMWRVLARRGEPDMDRLMNQVLDLAWQLELRDMVPLCERFLISHLGEDAEQVVTALLMARPDSIQLRQVAAVQALERGDEEAWAGHLLAGARTLIQRRDLLTASKMVMAARTRLDSPEVSSAQMEVLELGGEIARISQEFREVEAKLGGDPTLAVERCLEFLEKYPGFEPAEEAVVQRADAARLPLRATEVMMDRGRRALLRDLPEEARQLFLRVLAIEFENDEAMLFLASLASDLPELPRDLRHVRAFLLEHCGLDEAAIHHALKGLRGSNQDTPLLELLVRRYRATGRDPSPQLLGLGTAALGRGELARARKLCVEAVTEGENPTQVVSRLMQVPEIDRILPRNELLGMLADFETI
jgi:hypothetical protein